MTLTQAKMLLIAECRRQRTPVPVGPELTRAAEAMLKAYHERVPEPEDEDDD